MSIAEEKGGRRMSDLDPSNELVSINHGCSMLAAYLANTDTSRSSMLRSNLDSARASAVNIEQMRSGAGKLYQSS